jgi:hypothetical protein
MNRNPPPRPTPEYEKLNRNNVNADRNKQEQFGMNSASIRGNRAIFMNQISSLNIAHGRGNFRVKGGEIILLTNMCMFPSILSGWWALEVVECVGLIWPL